MLVICKHCKTSYRIPDGLTRIAFPCKRCQAEVSYSADEENSAEAPCAKDMSVQRRAANNPTTPELIAGIPVEGNSMQTNHPYLAWLEVNLGAIGRNLDLVRGLCPKSQILAIVKTNAYGFGVKEVSDYLFSRGIRDFALAKPYEALLVKRANPDANVLLMGPSSECLRELVEAKVQLACFSNSNRDAIAKHAASSGVKVQVQVKVDTGVHRLGVRHEHAADFIVETARNPNLELKAAYSTFSEVKEVDRLQWRRLCEIREAVEARGVNTAWHIASSASILRYPQSHCEFVRAGIILYGHYPNPEEHELKRVNLEPAMTMHARVIQVKPLHKGEGVSYRLTYTAPEDHKVALIVFGGLDGFMGKKVILGGRFCEVIGNLTQNHAMIHVAPEMDVKEGDLVTMMGCQDGLEISPAELARDSNLSIYSVHARISDKMPRIYFDD